MAWIQLLLFSFLSFTPLTTLSRSGSEDEPESPFKSICEGVRTELSNCNKRLLEKTEYSFNIEKDMFTLKEQLREIRVLCINASQVSAVQIAALQNQLDRMLKQLGEQATGPAAVVLDILQKYVEVQKLELNLLIETDPSKIAELQKQLKKLRADLEEVNGNLDKLECQAVNNSQILHVVSLQQQIDELRKTGGSESSSILVLETQLEKEMRHLEGNKDAASKLIRPIIRLQDEIVELYERQAVLLITHIQFTAFQSRLGEKKILLSDLQQEKEEKGDDGIINEQIEAVEREVRQLEAKIDDLKKNLSQKPELKKELQEKKTQLEVKLKQMKNDSQELISQILTLQLELRVRQIEAQGDQMAARAQITDLEKELSEKSERITELLGQNQYLEEKITDTLAECNDLQENYSELLNKVEELTAKVNDSNLRQILDIVSLNQEINNLEDRIRSETSKSKRNELQKELREKKEQLDSKTKELKTNEDLNTRITLRIISKLDELRKLQIENVGVDQIKDKRDELLGLLSELDDSNLAKILLKNLFLLSDESRLKKLISHLKQQTDKQIAELQEEVRKKEEELRRKTTELGQKDRDVATLTKEIRDLEEELKNLKKQLKDLENTSASQLRDLEEQLSETRKELEKGNKALQEKDAELAEKDVIDDNKRLRDDVTRLNERVKELENLEKELNEKSERITELLGQNQYLEEKITDTLAECNNLQENYSELLNKVEELTAKVNDSNLRQILDIVSLNQEINNLEDRIRSETSKSKRNELQKELREKKEQLDSKTKELKTNEDLNTRITLTIISKLDNLRKLQIENVGVDQIKDKRDELLGLLSELDDSNLAKILLKNLFLLSDESRLKKLISHLKQQTDKQIAELQEEVRKKEEELRRKTTELGQKDRDVATLTKEIRDLEEELKNLKKQLKDLENTSASQLRDLEEQLSETRKELEKGNKALQEKDAELAEKDVIDDNKRLRDDVTRLNERVKELEKLEEQLNKKEEELSDLHNNNAELEEQLKKKEEELSHLNNNTADVIDDNKRLRDDVTRLNERVKELEKLEEQLNKKEEELSDLNNNNAELEEQLKKKEEELSHLNNNTADVIDDNKRLRDDVTRLNERVKELEKLEEQLNKKEEELSDLNNNNAELEEQLKKKEKELSQLNNNTAELEEQLKEKEEELSDLHKNKNVIEENERLRDLVTTLHERVKELEKQPVTEKPSKDISVASLEFDLQTAHRRLLISTDGKTARGAEYASAVRDSPKRYDTVIAALTKTGFISGRHYWEVQVKERSCFVVGVAAESAPRKGEIRYKPSNGYWTILRKKDRRHQAQTERPFTLRIMDKLSIIGILLDFTKGEVAFYNVQTRELLYKFRGNNFTEKLYPYVATCTDEDPQESPIELLQPRSPLWLE